MRLQRLFRISSSFILCLILFLPCIVAADPLDNWHLRSTSQTDNLYAVTYGNGIFVSVGAHGLILESTDGLTWTERRRSLFVSPTPLLPSLYGIAYGNGTFVAVGESSILTSTDGVNWTDQSVSLYSGISEFNSFKFILEFLVREAYAFCPANHLAGLWAVCYGNDEFIAVGGSRECLPKGIVKTSVDGKTWINKVSPEDGYDSFARIAYGIGTYVALTHRGDILSSSDTINWVMRDSHKQARDIAYGNGFFVSVGKTILTSPDLINWTERISPVAVDLYRVVFGNGVFVAVGENGTILTCPDGRNWTQRSSGTTRNLNGVAYGNNTFTVVGDNGLILQSDSLIDVPPIPINNPPFAPTLVYPADTRAGLSTPVTFIWRKSSDSDGDPVIYNLYVCEDQSFTGCNPVQIASNTGKPIYAGIGVRFIAAAVFLFGVIISFRTSKKNALFLIAVITAAMLFISCGGGGDGSGNNTAPPPIGPDEISHTVSELKSGTVYYWKVVADDGRGGITESDMWSFSTK